MGMLSGPVAVGALGNLVAAAIATASGHTWKSLRTSPEARAVEEAVGAALSRAMTDGARPGATTDDDWVAQVALMWQSAFTPEVVGTLISCLADPSEDSIAQFSRFAREGLENSGCDIAMLERTFWVEEFLAALPAQLFSQLRAASLRDDKVRGLVDHLLRQRAEARADSSSSPGVFRRDLVKLLRALETWARTGLLPAYLPTGADTAVLSREVRVRRGIRAGRPDGLGWQSGTSNVAFLGTQALPSERVPHKTAPEPWRDVAKRHRRLMVLADPGLGKSWLVRSETRRLCQEALADLAKGVHADAIIPVPMRCDQLAAAQGRDLADKAAAFLAAQGVLPRRSVARVAAKIRAGRVVLLLDAVDELTPAQDGSVRMLTRTWAEQVGEQAQCVITSRLAGYIGPLVPDSCEVELEPFTVTDVAGAVNAWDLPSRAASQVMDRLRDPAIASMARIPLLLALMCSLAASSEDDEIPRTRGQLLDRVLRWFLTRPHRSPDDPSSTLDAVGVSALLELLEPLAFAFASHPSGWVDLMAEDHLLRTIRSISSDIPGNGSSAADLLRVLSVGAGILVPTGDPSAGRSPGYLFFHRAVAEYLVARHIATLPESRWLAIVEQHRWFDPDWTEAILMLGERLPSAAACILVDTLSAEQVDPFQHSFFMAIKIWGMRPDADLLLSESSAEKLVQRLDSLARREANHIALKEILVPMAYPPGKLLETLVELTSEPSLSVRRFAAQTLAGQYGPRVAGALQRLLGRSDDEVRRVAAMALERHDSPAAVSALLGLLWDPAKDLRILAVRGLAHRTGQEVTDNLRRLRGDPDEDVSRLAAQALVDQGSPGAAGELLNMLGDPDKDIQLLAAQALAGFDMPEVTEALVGLLGCSDKGLLLSALRGLVSRSGLEVTEALQRLATDADADPDARRLAADGLAGREGPAVTSALRCLLDDPDESLRRIAARALADRDWHGTANEIFGLLGDHDENIRRFAVRGLEAHEGERVTGSLLGLLRDPDEEVRRLASRALADRDDPEITGALLELLSDVDEEVRLLAAAALAGREGAAVTERMLSLLTDPEKRMRRTAARALAGRDGAGVIEALIGLLREPEMGTRWLAAESLAAREGPAVTEALVGLLTEGENIVRRLAAQALATRDWPQGTEVLLGLLRDPDDDIRRSAAHGLAGRTDPRVGGRLLQLLKERDRDLMRSVAAALVRSGWPGTTEALLSLLSDSDEEARLSAAQALAVHVDPDVSAEITHVLWQPGRKETWRAAATAMAGREDADAVRSLIALLSHQDHIVRCTAARALAGRQDPEASQSLLVALSDPEKTVRQAAAEALRNRKVAHELVRWVRENLKSATVDIPLVISLAEQIMLNSYRMMDTDAQQSIRKEMAWLAGLA